jgi:predicted nucleic acid-binding protein
MVVRGHLDADSAVTARDRILTMPVRLSSPPSLFTRTWSLAVDLGRPQAYDCFYLATAELLDTQLWTADERFYNAAAARFGDRVRLLGTSSVEGEVGAR